MNPQILQQMEQTAFNHMISKEYTSAADLLGQILSLRTQEFGEISENLAPLYHYYGKCLLYSTQDEITELGEIVRENVKEILSSNPNEEMEEMDFDGKEDDNDIKEELSEANQSIQIAIENLEVAKSIYSKNEDKYRIQLSEVYLLTADHFFENEDFEIAENDYKKSLQYRRESGIPDDRTTAGMHYSVALAIHNQNRNKEALDHLMYAKMIIESNLVQCRSIGDLQKTQELESVLIDLIQKGQQISNE